MATRNIVPRATGEGQIGTSAKTWSAGYFNDIAVTNGVTASTFTGDLTGDVTGDVTGNLTGNVTGDVTGDVTGTASGNLPLISGAGFHNSIFRGKNLGNAVTTEQYNAIDAGTFDDLFIGDYWVINGINWRIAAFDYWLHMGDTECLNHHVVIVPDSVLATCKMNNTSTTDGGYVNSDFYKGTNSNTGKSTAQSAINNAFGSTHILTHRELLTTGVSSGSPNSWAWYNSTLELMNESMVYGNSYSHATYNIGIDISQLPLFALMQSYISIPRADWWLRSIVSATQYGRIGWRGNADSLGATSSLGVRPVFGICKSN